MGVSFYGKASLIMDGAAVLILIGMIINTSLYRKRGKIEDKLFFAIILTDIVAALFEGAIYLADGIGLSLDLRTYKIIFYIYFLIMDTFAFLWCFFLMFRLKWEGKKLKYGIIISGILLIILFIVSFDLGFVDERSSWSISIGRAFITYYLFFTLLPALIVALFTLIAVFKKSKRILILAILIIIPQVWLAVASMAYNQPLILAVAIIYAHLFVMRDPFYEEVV